MGKKLVVVPRLLFGGMMPQLSDVVIENRYLCQKGDTFGHHYGVGDRLTSFLRELSPPFQWLYRSGKGFRGIVGPHHIYCILLEVNFVYRPVA